MTQLNITFPDSEQLDQNEEYFILNGEEKIKFHDYIRIFQTPHLYETVFHQHLKCQSPTVIANLLFKQVKANDSIEQLRILDFGAGNGLVARALSKGNPELIVGVDILDEAKQAALRERDDIYKDYLVADLTKAELDIIKKLRSLHFNAMVTVAALGFDHIPPESFINAFNLVESNGWIAFNLRDRFLSNSDDSGFKEILEGNQDDCMQILEEKTYVHRLNTKGEPIRYTAIVAKKLKDIKPL